MREILLAYDIRIQKNLQTKEDTFWIFRDFHGGTRVQSPTCIPHRNFINGVANPEIVDICCYFFKYFVLTDFFFFKNAYFERKFVKYLMELTRVGSINLKVF